MKRKNLLILIILFVVALFAAIFWPEKELNGNFLASEISKIEAYASSQDVVNEKVSRASVGWHLDHVLLVVNSIYKQLVASDPKLYKSKFNFTKTLVFTINGIPRGRGEAPNRVRPDENIGKKELLEHLKRAQELVGQFDSLPQKSYFAHPYFGMLDRKDAKKFVKIHTNHHLKIVKDILKNP